MLCYRLSIAGLCALSLVGCRDPVAPQQALNAARDRWAQRGTSSYDITVSKSCECLDAWTDPVIVSVRNGIVESRRYAATGAAVPASVAHGFPTIEGLFDIIDAAMQDGVAKLEVRYDASLGHPLEISIDRVAVMVDDEVTYFARNLVPR